MQNRQAGTVDLADIFSSITNQLRSDRDQINAVDGSNGNHGDNALSNFEMVTNVLNGMRGQDAGQQLRQAANVLEQNGQGSTANLYAGGLLEAAQRLQGKDGIGLDDVLPLLQGLLGGVQGRTAAQPGQGTLLDTLLPAVSSYTNARQSGRSNSNAIMDALGAALRGSQQTYQQPAQYGRSSQQTTLPRRDPGAASANSLLHGLFQSLTGLS